MVEPQLMSGGGGGGGCNYDIVCRLIMLVQKVHDDQPQRALASTNILVLEDSLPMLKSNRMALSFSFTIH